MFAAVQHSPTGNPGLRKLWTDFRNLSAILQGAPTPTGWPTARARHIASSALRSSSSASLPCSGQATTPAEIAIRSPPAASSSSSIRSSRSAHLHAPDRVLVRRQHAERVLLEAEGLVDEADAVAQRGADHRQHRLLAVAAVARRAPPARRRRRRRGRRGARSACSSRSAGRDAGACDRAGRGWRAISGAGGGAPAARRPRSTAVAVDRAELLGELLRPRRRTARRRRRRSPRAASPAAPPAAPRPRGRPGPPATRRHRRYRLRIRVATRRPWRKRRTPGPRNTAICGADNRLGTRPPGRLIEAAATGEGLAEGDLVGVLEVGADRQAAGQAGDRDAGRAAARRCAARSPRRSWSGWWRARPRCTSPASTRRTSSAIFRSSASTPSIGERAPPSTW